ncbi:hypothetical protein BCR44DRAFT_1436033 [Catenaria anguillulae PL171]|uniref:Uncharacterized protein n=1 Tax=Catenaria anguillulae PL171 TaxID=765915 RepID=A0A1Y2HJ28_9FUNG|nr:hypothetical protein BCR44DRAFT_1436033 [Catenaria anguillulae PL171]
MEDMELDEEDGDAVRPVAKTIGGNKFKLSEVASSDDEEIDEDDAFNSDDEDRFAGFKFYGGVCGFFRPELRFPLQTARKSPRAAREAGTRTLMPHPTHRTLTASHSTILLMTTRAAATTKTTATQLIPKTLSTCLKCSGPTQLRPATMMRTMMQSSPSKRATQ